MDQVAVPPDLDPCKLSPTRPAQLLMQRIGLPIPSIEQRLLEKVGKRQPRLAAEIEGTEGAAALPIQGLKPLEALAAPSIDDRRRRVVGVSQELVSRCLEECPVIAPG